MIQIPQELAQNHLKSSCHKGDVLFWKGFPGKEKLRDSYFVLLTNCIDDKFLAARATVQTQYYFSGSGTKRLEHDIVFIKSGEATSFSKDTVVDLTWRRWFFVNDLAKLLGAGIEKRDRLPENIINRINKCVKEAITISEIDRKTILDCQSPPCVSQP